MLRFGGGGRVFAYGGLKAVENWPSPVSCLANQVGGGLAGIIVLCWRVRDASDRTACPGRSCSAANF